MMSNLDISAVGKCHSIEEWIPKSHIRIAGLLGSSMSLLGIVLANVESQSSDPGKAFAAKIGDWSAITLATGKVNPDMNIGT